MRRSTYKPRHPQEQFIVPLLQRHIDRLLQLHALPSPESGHVLDVGCGRQPFRAILESRGYAYTGLDVEQNPEGTVEIVCSIDQNLPQELAFESFQFVLCTEVLEHVADWDVAFRNLAALTAPGGHILITCPHFYPLHEEPYDYWRPTHHAVRYFAERVNLTIAEEVKAGDAWDVLGTALTCCWPSVEKGDFKSRVMRKIVSAVKTRFFNILVKEKLQKMVPMNGPLYMSNIFVLERPA